jgi:hypothetical protein
MYLLHGGACILHRIKCFLVDVRRFNTVDLLLDLCNLCSSLLQAALVDLFPAQGGFRSYNVGSASRISIQSRLGL